MVRGAKLTSGDGAEGSGFRWDPCLFHLAVSSPPLEGISKITLMFEITVSLGVKIKVDREA